MATEQDHKAEGTQEVNGSEGIVGFAGKIKAKIYEVKEHAETYPYVWGSYIFTYGTLGLWLAYRWTKLRRTEDRVRALQERLRKLYEAEEAASSSSSSPHTKADKSASSISSSAHTKADKSASSTSSAHIKADSPASSTSSSAHIKADSPASSTNSPSTKADNPSK